MRAENLNEEYYARNNHPSFHQLGKDYDFYDDKGRFYWIMQQNEDTFQNKNLRETPDKGRCVVNSYQEVSLFVKLEKGALWFGEEDSWNDFMITSRLNKQDYAVRLESRWQGVGERRAGRIEVKGLGQELCDSLLLLRLSERGGTGKKRGKK